MYPDQSNQPGQQQQPPQQFEYSIDYLDQISAPPKRVTAPNPFVLLAVIAVGVLTIIGFGIFMLGSNGKSSADKASNIYLRTQTLQKIADSTQKQLRDNDLRSTNAAFSLYLSNMIRDIKEPLANLKVSTEKLPKSLTDKETAYASDITTRFEEAKLNIMLDRTYAREMSYQISVLRNMMAGLYKATSNTSLKSALGTSDPSLAQTGKKFQEFSGSH